MKFLIHIAVLFFVTLAVRAGGAWEAMQQGLKDYAAGNFSTAATNFDGAVTAAEKEKFDPAVPSFNRANALLMSGKPQDAAQAYEQSLRTSDLGLQGRAYHNRGNSLLGVAGAQEQQQKFEEAIKSVDEAMAMYERSMLLDPKDRDPKVNYELAGLKRRELEEKKKQQEQEQQQNKEQNKDQQKDEKNKDQNQGDNQNQQDQQQQDQQNQEQQNPEKQGDQQTAQEEQQEQRERTEKMSQQEAAMLLDAMKQREQAQREKLMQIWLKRSQAAKMQPVDKDW